MSYEFTLQVLGSRALDAALEHALYRNGCDDATLYMRDGEIYAVFDRLALTFDAAIRSAIRDVRAAGYYPVFVIEPHTSSNFRRNQFEDRMSRCVKCGAVFNGKDLAVSVFTVVIRCRFRRVCLTCFCDPAIKACWVG